MLLVNSLDDYNHSHIPKNLFHRKCLVEIEWDRKKTDDPDIVN